MHMFLEREGEPVCLSLCLETDQLVVLVRRVFPQLPVARRPSLPPALAAAIAAGSARQQKVSQTAGAIMAGGGLAPSGLGARLGGAPATAVSTSSERPALLRDFSPEHGAAPAPSSAGAIRKASCTNSVAHGSHTHVFTFDTDPDAGQEYSSPSLLPLLSTSASVDCTDVRQVHLLTASIVLPMDGASGWCFDFGYGPSLH